MPEKISILITGGAGFIASHTCKALAECGHVPVTIDNLSTGHRDAVKWGPFYKCDLRERDHVAEIAAKHQVQAVMHFAASAYVGESVARPDLYYDNNVGGMIALLEACRASRVGQIVFSSSCATYGEPPSLPITEDTPQRPINPYGRTKLICEDMLRDHAAAFGTRYVSLRYFNAAGADPDGELSERHDPETHLIPLALRAAAGKGELSVFGTDYPTPDGTCVRDYIHVSDLAQGHVLALNHLIRGGANVALNLGRGQGYSIREILQVIEKVTGCPVPTCAQPRRPGDPPELVADCSLARDVLGFVARHSDIRQIIQDAAPSFGLTALPTAEVFVP